ncbi:MAG: hypothetical protein M0Q92_10490 [Methanoregula sp.]|nr:hypothetical protein [Methanoregula sp.]
MVTKRHPDTMAARDEATETAFIPMLEKDGRGKMTFTCPEKLPDTEAYCWKFSNPDPSAQYDFWMILTLQRLGEMMLVSQMIPMSNGQLLLFRRYNEYQAIMKSTYIKQIRLKHSDYGIVQIARMKVREYYEGIFRIISTSKFTVYRFGPDGTLLEIKTSKAFEPPPLPAGNLETRSVSPKYVISQLDIQDISPQDTIRFPDYEIDASGDIVVNNGDEYRAGGGEGQSLDTSLTTRPPGIYVDFAQQSGSPHLIIEIFSMVSVGEKPRILSGFYCTSTHYCYETVRVHVFQKKKRSWFHTKTKIRIVREEIKLNIEGVKCSDI